MTEYLRQQCQKGYLHVHLQPYNSNLMQTGAGRDVRGIIRTNLTPVTGGERACLMIDDVSLFPCRS